MKMLSALLKREGSARVIHHGPEAAELAAKGEEVPLWRRPIMAAVLAGNIVAAVGSGPAMAAPSVDQLAGALSAPATQIAVASQQDFDGITNFGRFLRDFQQQHPDTGGDKATPVLVLDSEKAVASGQALYATFNGLGALDGLKSMKASEFANDVGKAVYDASSNKACVIVGGANVSKSKIMSAITGLPADQLDFSRVDGEALDRGRMSHEYGHCPFGKLQAEVMAGRQDADGNVVRPGLLQWLNGFMREAEDNGYEIKDALDKVGVASGDDAYSKLLRGAQTILADSLRADPGISAAILRDIKANPTHAYRLPGLANADSWLLHVNENAADSQLVLEEGVLHGSTAMPEWWMKARFIASHHPDSSIVRGYPNGSDLTGGAIYDTAGSMQAALEKVEELRGKPVAPADLSRIAIELAIDHAKPLPALIEQSKAGRAGHPHAEAERAKAYAAQMSLAEPVRVTSVADGNAAVKEVLADQINAGHSPREAAAALKNRGKELLFDNDFANDGVGRVMNAMGDVGLENPADLVPMADSPRIDKDKLARWRDMAQERKAAPAGFVPH